MHLKERLGSKFDKGAEAGVKFRNILLNMTGAKVLDKLALKDLKKAGVNLDIVSSKTLPLNTRLLEMSKIANDTNAIMHVFGTKICYLCIMDAQEQHIAILKKMATAGQMTMPLPGVMLKINASDVIEAGKRLEEMGIFAFDSKTNDVKIVVEIVDPIKKPT